MSIQRTREQLYHTTDAGLVVPIGTVSHLSMYSRQTLLQMKEKAVAVEKLYSDNNLLIPSACELAHLIENAKQLSDAWLLNSDDATMPLMFRVMCLDRIADAILPLSTVPSRVKYLTILTSGSLNLQQRLGSYAKNILWELELWSTLLDRAFNAVLQEPPDIVVRFEDSEVGIACKKFYSESNVEKVLSEAVAQIEGAFDFGIVAMNLDDLLPPDAILKGGTQLAINRHIDMLNQDFLTRHKRHFKKYLDAGRVLSVVVFTNVITDSYKEKPRYKNSLQATVWTVPGLPPEKTMQLQRFYTQLME
jgi:hypothetical protein